MTAIYYRFRCYACPYVRETQNRAEIPDYCPACGYPKERARHIYRAEPPDGAELDA